MSNKKNSKNKDALTEEQRQKQDLKVMKQLDPTVLKEDIYNLRVQLKDLIARKIEVQNQIAIQNESYMKDTFSLQQTIKTQEEKIIDLENKFKALEKTYENVMNKSKTDWESQMEQLVTRKRSQKVTIMSEYDSIRKKVEHMKLFKQREQQYTTTIQGLEERLQNTKKSHVRDIEKIKTEHNRNREELADRANRQVEQIKQSEVNKLQSKMTRQQHIRKENELMSEQIALCESQKQVLEEECQQLMREITNERGNTSGNLLGGQASETYQRSLRVIKLEGKVAKLKAFLTDQTERLDNEFNKLQAAYDQKQKQHEDRLLKMQGSIRMKERDNKKLKACAQMVLNQRSHLEAYMLEVFHEHPEIDPKDERNVNQILRYLFIKINSNKQPVSYKHYLSSTQQTEISSESMVE